MRPQQGAPGRNWAGNCPCSDSGGRLTEGTHAPPVDRIDALWEGGDVEGIAPDHDEVGALPALYGTDLALQAEQPCGDGGRGKERLAGCQPAFGEEGQFL